MAATQGFMPPACKRSVLAATLALAPCVAAHATPTLAARAAAAQTAAQTSPQCAAIRPFYWEIGDARGALASGSVERQGHRGAPTYSAHTVMAIASASKWPFAAMLLATASAQDSSSPSSSRSERMARFQQMLEQRFAQADSNHDGKLTLAEAQAGMPRLAEHFDAIDTQHRGYITLREIDRYLIAQARQRRAQQQGGG